MGVDYYAYAVIGVLLPGIPMAKRVSRKPAFKHEYDDNGKMEFDPKTGAKLWLDEFIEVDAEYPGVVFIESYTDRNGNVCEDYHSPLRGGQSAIHLPGHLDIVRATSEDKIYVGYIAMAESYNPDSITKVKVLPDLNILKEEIRNILDPYGLWREELFGLYSVLVCSF